MPESTEQQPPEPNKYLLDPDAIAMHLGTTAVKSHMEIKQYSDGRPEEKQQVWQIFLTVKSRDQERVNALAMLVNPQGSKVMIQDMHPDIANQAAISEAQRDEQLRGSRGANTVKLAGINNVYFGDVHHESNLIKFSSSTESHNVSLYVYDDGTFQMIFEEKPEDKKSLDTQSVVSAAEDILKGNK